MRSEFVSVPFQRRRRRTVASATAAIFLSVGSLPLMVAAAHQNTTRSGATLGAQADAPAKSSERSSAKAAPSTGGSADRETRDGETIDPDRTRDFSEWWSEDDGTDRSSDDAQRQQAEDNNNEVNNNDDDEDALRRATRAFMERPSRQPYAGYGRSAYTRPVGNASIPRTGDPQLQGRGSENLLTFEGELEAWQRRPMRGAAGAHTLVRMRLDDGRSMIVNLGPRLTVDRLQLNRGDRVSVQGSRGSINNTPVLMTSRVRVDGETWSTNTGGVERPTSDRRMRDRPSDWGQGQRQVGSQGMMQDRRRMMQDSRSPMMQQRNRTSENEVDAGNMNGDRMGASATERPSEGASSQNDEYRQQYQQWSRRFGQQPQPQSQQQQSPQSQPSTQPSSQQGERQNEEPSTSDPQGNMSNRQDAQRGRPDPRDAPAPGYISSRIRHIQQVTAAWPEQSLKSAKAMVRQYGPPNGATSSMLIWQNNGPWVRTIVYDTPVDHRFPTPHEDVLEQFVRFEVPTDRMDELAEFDGSITVYRTAGLVSARCQEESMNILALNLAKEVVEDKKTVEEARRTFAETAQAWMQGERPPMTEQLMFDPRNGDAASPDERWKSEEKSRSNDEAADSDASQSSEAATGEDEEDTPSNPASEGSDNSRRDDLSKRTKTEPGSG